MTKNNIKQTKLQLSFQNKEDLLKDIEKIMGSPDTLKYIDKLPDTEKEKIDIRKILTGEIGDTTKREDFLNKFRDMVEVAKSSLEEDDMKIQKEDPNISDLIRQGFGKISGEFKKAGDEAKDNTSVKDFMIKLKYDVEAEKFNSPDEEQRQK